MPDTKQQTGIVFTQSINKTSEFMISTFYSDVRKKLALRYILENIDYRKRCVYLQDIIFLSKTGDLWQKALDRFFDIPLKYFPFRKFSKN